MFEENVFVLLAEYAACQVCALCRAGIPRHTNAERSIGGADRYAIVDIHAVDDPGGVGLVECDAGDIWLAIEGAKKARELRDRESRAGLLAGSPAPADGGSSPPASTSS